MKYIFVLLIGFSFYANGQTKSKLTKSKPVLGIHWMSIEEVQEQIKIIPKKVFVDIYQNGNDWCRIMQSKVFTNKNVINYINENFYAIHLNAETSDSILFKEKKYGKLAESGVNELAAEFMENKIRYPNSIFFDETFSNAQPIPGYLDVPTIEMILKYIATNNYKKVRFEKYKDEFRGTW